MNNFLYTNVYPILSARHNFLKYLLEFIAKYFLYMFLIQSINSFYDNKNYAIFLVFNLFIVLFIITHTVFVVIIVIIIEI